MPTPTAAPRRVLLVAYYYPPLNIIGARRPYALAKWLRRRGHDVTVLTSVQSGRGPDDGASRVVRARDLLATRLNWRGSASLAAATGASDDAWDPNPGLWGSIFVPDVQAISWAPFAVEAACRLHRRHRFDVVVTTSPVESVHAVGVALRRRGVPWVADMRDGWRFEAPRPDWPLALQRRVDDRLERAALRRADEIVIVTEPLADDLRARLDLPVDVITNGFDPDDEAAARGAAAPTTPGKLTLAHTGGLGPRQTLRPLLEALAQLGDEDPTVRDRVELVLVGQTTHDQRALYAHPRYAPFIRCEGFVPRPVALALQRTADLLVLVTSGVRRGEATGKLFEYLAAGRPILAFGEGNAAAQIVRGAEAGEVVAVDDPDGAARVVRRLLDGTLPRPPPGARDAYAYPALAARYEQVLERAIARAGRR